MKRFVHLKLKLALTLVAMLYYAGSVALGVPCWFKLLTGLPCPGCGITRAWTNLLVGNVARAFVLHPWFWSVPILYLYILADGKLLGHKHLDRWIVALCLGGFAIVFVCRLLFPAWRV